MTIAPSPETARPDTLPGTTGAPALRTRPAALLLDFGGVVLTTSKRPGGLEAVAEHVAATLARAGHRRSAAELLPVLQGGKKALKDWKNASSRLLEPTELDHRTIWREFYGSPLTAAEREVLAGSAGQLQETITRTLTDHAVRPGVRELVRTARRLGVPLGIVSNAHSGRAHRAILAEQGLASAFAVQVYSDEVGIRKPHPGMIELAARALGTTPDRCWYVGDTFDRDVVAGRRAGTGAVVLTRDHHTDRPPFPVAEEPDLVLEDPRGLAGLLAESRPDAPARPPAPPAAAARRAVSALLLDHGGVIAVSRPDDVVRRGFAARLAAGLSAAGYPTGTDEAVDVLDRAHAAHKAWKDQNEQADDGDTAVAEIDAPTFWVDLVGPLLEHHGTGVRHWLRAEAHALMVDYARTKSTPTVRPGVRELLTAARDAGVPVAVVSNTVCGRAVREELVEHGLDDLVGAHVYSDELGLRKPDPTTVRTALAALDADAARAVFVGDKPHRDVAAARAAGVGTVVLVRGGSTGDEALAALPAGGEHTPDHQVAEIDEVAALLRGLVARAGTRR
ncbi:HAD superfamily hydrolase (TIGR01509 family)/HAD superfamily hydrolase (TIGR01549 family) [Isoptericola sp. CG 20/1183]|uniref:HAD superfamily hydrolase (TIGR01509 family)/HAD superfamily hydrolase (TIGR01549 family) n=1 Tax=Isoptericola halotolerans TaxID=300560 RepID=A0ABX5EIZ5_9MICO|nr:MULTISPECIES: HAD family hydrolase [Isoptericola]PRZ09487.1 HAD superfamily hydrolase (TIGR01509 family)/HAD superfamily hydrolase (TIGR01549 family) [Isoptericola sp. CG 20/1183]PRZ10288.1 HAD superfamily hydrolase (TIGR01509 family)/HAD superfamily hydrolase (TIGR01549 family) [Isoptericola halotolerans]